MLKQIAYITDIHIDESFPIQHGVDARKNWDIVLDDVRARGIDHIIFGGDAGEKETNEWFFNTMKEFRLDMVLGNHDYYDEVIKHYSNEFQHGHKEMYYSHEDDYFKFIFLDSSSATISEIQLNWFKGQLDTSKKVLLFVHHAVLEVKTLVDTTHPLHNRNIIRDTLKAAGLETTIFCGHYHMHDVQTDENIKQIISPATSYQIIKEADPVEVHSRNFGYQIITINGSEINTELVLFNT